MEIFESLIPVGIVLLCIAGVVALGAMAYLFITLTKSMKETFEKVDPLVVEAKEALDTAKPALERIDPLMERITLTVDAANLEIMRVDQILEDVNTITGNVSKATESLDNITSLPLTSRLRSRIAPLGAKAEDSRVGAVVQVVDQKLDSVETCVSGAQARADVKRAEAAEAVAAREEAQAQTNEMSSNLKDAFSVQISRDSESAQN